MLYSKDELSTACLVSFAFGAIGMFFFLLGIGALEGMKGSEEKNDEKIEKVDNEIVTSLSKYHWKWNNCPNDECKDDVAAQVHIYVEGREIPFSEPEYINYATFVNNCKRRYLKNYYE